jgi:DNA adenine methylase
MGGKSRLAKTIIPLIPEHHCYCEVFAGAAWILFSKPPSDVEIINDLNVELVTLYKVVRHHLEEFVKHLKWLLVARDEYDSFMKSAPETLTDIQRAVRFYYIARTSYGARVGHNPSFSVSTNRPSNFNLLRIEEDLSAAHIRLARVFVENRPYQQFVERFDKDGVFMYVDPPYFGCEDYYGKDMFSRSDFLTLRDMLGEAKSKWMLSINDVPEMRKVFDGFNIKPVRLDYSVGVRKGEKRKSNGELLIMNY